jgi:hypothetical protein
MADTPDTEPLTPFLGQVVVLDTQGPLLYVGVLRQITPSALLLAEADVHDTNDSSASKELYLVETRDLGVRANRGLVLVMRQQIASISLLEDVID